jgi:hypothetical protein
MTISSQAFNYGDYHINEGSTTIPDGSTSQANGDGNALPE